ncbi:hypothetical protein LCGC14_1706540 [marine sediment metagenome]|uniref:Uncharacterized protein n=1 Tax=marine sediment metagenome TaxID=412755 RepID=A0A0F9I415_9ZZZZ
MNTKNNDAQRIIDKLDERNDKIEEKKRERESIKEYKKSMGELGITVL